MNVSRLFIQRPVATGLFMLAIVLAGLVGFRFLPVAALPQVDYPTIQVQTLYPGGSPDVMSRTVTAPLERNHLEVEETTGSGQEKTGTKKVIAFKKAIIAAGSQAVRLPFMPDDPRVVDSTGALALTQVPQRMLVLGG